MKLKHSRRTGRRGFTLVEMLVVMLIIGVLVSLIAAVAWQALASAKRARNVNEIQQLATALEQFKQKFGRYPPSRLRLAEKYGYYSSTNPLDLDSIEFLTAMFPRIDIALWTSTGMDWNGNGTIDPPVAAAGGASGYVLLEGDQVLVFCLGGIPGPSTATTGLSNTVPSVRGFATNPKMPAPLPAADTADRLGPFYEFDSGRLVMYHPAVNPQHFNVQRHLPTLYYSYLDTYGRSDGLGQNLAGAPYAYFSSYKTPNGYNRYFHPQTAFSDCSGLGVWPYAESASKYLKPNSFQIIAPGADGQFGPGTDLTQAPNLLTWTPATAPNVNPQGTPGYDDQSNFTGSILGVGQD
jgi:general secretion pathway protein G